MKEAIPISYEKTLEELLTSEQRRLEIMARRPDGGEFPVELSVIPIRSPGHQGSSAFLRDITERKRHESEMKALNEALEGRVHERTAWLSLLYDITRAANEAETVGQAFRFASERICREGIWVECWVYIPAKDDVSSLLCSSYLSYPSSPERMGRLRVKRGEGSAGRAFLQADVDVAAQDGADGPSTILSFPVIVRGDIVAVFQCVSSRSLERNENLIRLMSAIGLELGHVVGRKRLQEEYADAMWQQQRRIAHELHDTLGQELTGLGFLSKSLLQAMRGTDGASAAERVKHGIERALEQIRGLAKGVMPVEQEEDGLMSALQQLCAAVQSLYGTPCRFECPNAVLVQDPQIAAQLYRIAQEAITNAMKHARAGQVVVQLEPGENGLSLKVSDDGIGIPAAWERAREGSGLRIMRYRAAALGAILKVERRVPAGTVVSCLLPEVDAGKAL